MAQTSFAAPPSTGGAVSRPERRSRKRGGPSPTVTGNFARLLPPAEQARIATNQERDRAAREAKGLPPVENVQATAAPAVAPEDEQRSRAAAALASGTAARERILARRAAEARAAEAQQAEEDRQQAATRASAAATAGTPDANGAQSRVTEGMTPAEAAAQKVRTDQLMAEFNRNSGAGRGAFGLNQPINTNRHVEGIVPRPGAEGFAKTLFNGTRTYENNTGYSPNELNEAVSDFFGRDVNFTQLGDMVGAPAGSTVNINSINSREIEVSIQNTLFQSQNRDIRRDGSGNVSIYNAYWRVNPDAPQAVGQNVFARQIEGSKNLGVKSIGVTAAGSGRQSGNYDGRYRRGEFVGYNTWARFGYNGPIPSEVARIMPSSIKTSTGATPTTMNQLMAAQGGKEFWKRNGVDWSGKFDLSDNSPSIQQFKNFLKERPTRPKLGISYLDKD